MVRLFVFSLLIIVVALWVTFYLGFPADPGYLLIAFRNYTFETSLFTLVVTLGAIYLLFRLLVIIFRWVNPAKLVRAGIAINEKGCILNLRMTRNDSKRIHGSDNGITNTRIHMHVKYVCPHENEVIAG